MSLLEESVLDSINFGGMQKHRPWSARSNDGGGRSMMPGVAGATGRAGSGYPRPINSGQHGHGHAAGSGSGRGSPLGSGLGAGGSGGGGGGSGFQRPGSRGGLAGSSRPGSSNKQNSLPQLGTSGANIGAPKYSFSLQQQRLAEMEFDPGLLNLTRPTVASIVQRAPINYGYNRILPVDRSPARLVHGRPLPFHSSDCVVGDDSTDPYGVHGTFSKEGRPKRAPPRYEASDPRFASGLTFDAYGWSSAREFVQALSKT